MLWMVVLAIRCDFGVNKDSPTIFLNLSPVVKFQFDKKPVIFSTSCGPDSRFIIEKGSAESFRIPNCLRYVDGWIRIKIGDHVATCQQEGITRLEMRVTVGTNREYVPISAGATVDCAYVRVFARALNMDEKAPDLFENVSSNCCDPGTGTTCDKNHRVKRIAFPRRGLNGYINADAIPPQTEILNLSNNTLQGFTSNTFPDSLKVLLLKDNQLKGSLPKLPLELQVLRVERNFLSGKLPVLPLGLKVLVLDESVPATNKFTGSIKLTKPKIVQIFGNFISNINITDSSLLNSTNCILTRNRLLNDPGLSNLEKCEQKLLQ